MKRNMTGKKAVVLVNIGSPDKPAVKPVRKYLFSFLNDKRVIDLPWLLRKVLVNLIIVPFRAPKSTKMYSRIWTKKGFPLIYYTNSLVKKLQKTLPGEYMVYGAMRYGNPSLKGTLHKIRDVNPNEITVFPLFPQYASSTTGSTIDFVMEEIRRWNIIPGLRFIKQFYDHPAFLRSFSKRIQSYEPHRFDHVVFSYHGLPLSQINKTHPGTKEDQCTCDKEMPMHGKHCYKATCYETSRLLAKELNLAITDYSVSFQSRLTKKWLAPFTDQTIIKLAEERKKRILIAAPSFVTDCLETLYELGEEYQRLFGKHGGQEVVLVESLNDWDVWVEAIGDIIRYRQELQSDW